MLCAEEILCSEFLCFGASITRSWHRHKDRGRQSRPGFVIYSSIRNCAHLLCYLVSKPMDASAGSPISGSGDTLERIGRWPFRAKLNALKMPISCYIRNFTRNRLPPLCGSKLCRCHNIQTCLLESFFVYRLLADGVKKATIVLSELSNLYAHKRGSCAVFWHYIRRLWMEISGCLRVSQLPTADQCCPGGVLFAMGSRMRRRRYLECAGIND